MKLLSRSRSDRATRPTYLADESNDSMERKQRRDSIKRRLFSQKMYNRTEDGAAQANCSGSGAESPTKSPQKKKSRNSKLEKAKKRMTMVPLSAPPIEEACTNCPEQPQSPKNTQKKRSSFRIRLGSSKADKTKQRPSPPVLLQEEPRDNGTEQNELHEPHPSPPQSSPGKKDKHKIMAKAVNRVAERRKRRAEDRVFLKETILMEDHDVNSFACYDSDSDDDAGNKSFGDSQNLFYWGLQVLEEMYLDSDYSGATNSYEEE